MHIFKFFENSRKRLKNAIQGWVKLKQGVRVSVCAWALSIPSIDFVLTMKFGFSVLENGDRGCSRGPEKKVDLFFGHSKSTISKRLVNKFNWEIWELVWGGTWILVENHEKSKISKSLNKALNVFLW